MRENFSACLAVTLGYEGGYSSVRSDPGNWTGGKVGKGILKGTKYGIAASSHPNLDIKNLTVADAGKIYRPEYWDKVAGDALPTGMDLTTFDYGVNSGPSRSAKALQAVLGVAQDGAIGPTTLAAAAKADTKAVIQKHCAKRLSFLKVLPTWASFKNGWAKRVAGVEAKAVAMYLATGRTIAATSDVKNQLLEERAAAKKNEGNNAKAATAVGSAGAGGTADIVVNPQHIDQIAGWVLVGLAVVAVVVVVALFIRARNHKLRADAYAAEAELAGGVR